MSFCFYYLLRIRSITEMATTIEMLREIPNASINITASFDIGGTSSDPPDDVLIENKNE
jgi:hypothetical protein